MPAHVSELIVPSRFNGPPSSGNGGWTAGLLAGALSPDLPPDGRHPGDHSGPDSGDAPEDRSGPWPAIEVSLRQPPPLDTRMHVEPSDGGGVVASFGGAVIASARPVDDTLTEVDTVPPAEARAARERYAGLGSHPFPTCFVCGPERAEGDGLRIFGGRVDDVDGRARMASTWTPHPSLAEDYHAYVDDVPRASLAAAWAALDCIGAWSGDLEDRMLVLGRMTARVDALPAIGEEHVVVGADRGQEGRKTFTASTLHDSDGRIVGSAEHVWIAIDPDSLA